ncbi:MAG: hypothetical protein RL410_969 [Actinomycetota bacterium]|jgi:hypothetical protein
MDEQEKRRKFERLRAALDGVELDPSQTSDDKPEPSQKTSRDAELLRDVPPHHGSK